jgi:DNA (cytosine-5)-methyltransferase 1
MTKFKEWPDANVNVLVGGTPCQSFSVAGLRKGLDDPRGNLMLTYLAIAARYRPQWLVWENVPGVLSSNGGLDFASLLRGMGECGYGFAYRILDAQYFGVAQRRRRVFVVGYLGNWRPAAAVLFERHSLSGHPAPSREKGQGAAANARTSLDVSCIGTLTAGFGKVGAPEVDAYTCIPAAQPIANTLTASRSSAQCPNEDTTLVTQPIPIDSMNHIAKALDTSRGLDPSCNQGVMAVQQAMAVRRLTPKECERLQGFPDNYTDIKPKGKATPDGPRYKALGNSMAVPVMAWIGQRIQKVQNILDTRENT